MRVGGTNRDQDIANCFNDIGVNAEILHLNDVLRRRNLFTYHGLVFPGGFAHGDYVRAGAIWGKKLRSLLNEDLKIFVDQRKPILGICNGFQVLVEAGLLPGFELFSKEPQAALANNRSGRFECRWVRMRKNPLTACIFTKEVGEFVRFPIAHGEGRFLVSGKPVLKQIVGNNQIVFQYVKTNGRLAGGSYPENPNGSVMDIAGICNPLGTIFGLMPHPEDAYFGYQMPNWTLDGKLETYGDGVGLVRSMVDYIERSF